jgi:hypothetical protein
MSTTPLTHHRIIELLEPFSRQGLRIDLAASDRLQRRLRFHGVEVEGEPALRETLQLDGSGTDWWQLTRTLVAVDAPGAPQAQVVSNGTRPGELLAAVRSVEAGRCFRVGPGFVVARSYWLAPSPNAEPALTDGSIAVDGLNLELSVPATSGVAASIVLTPAAGAALDLPQDLLAVLGWNWAPLQRSGGMWKSRVRLRRGGSARTADAERALDRAAEHLARTLAVPPGRFHDQHRRARWGVVLRRALPTLTAISLLATVALLPRMGVDKIEGAWTLLYHLPTLLLAGAFMLQEMPRFEIPRWPRRSAAPDWRAAPQAPRRSIGGSRTPVRR